MQRLGLNQSLQQKLSPQQIQFIKLLQVPTAELEARIEEELELNPVLEQGEEEEGPDETPTEVEQEEPTTDEPEPEKEDKNEELDIDDYLRDDDYASYKTQVEHDDEEEREMPMAMGTSLHETLLTQLGFLGLDERQTIIGKQLVGSIEGDGYIRRELESIVNDLAFSQGIETTLEEV
jgi:RNA polymerase sigma-54 factor